MAISTFKAGTVSNEAPARVPASEQTPAAGPVSRLLVLVPPDTGLDAELAERAWRLAAPEGLPVVLVGLAHDGASEALRRRQLASLAALTRGEGVAVTTHLALEQSWLPAVRRLWAPGDLIVCFTGQQAPGGWLGLRRQPLAQALARALRAPLVQAPLSSVSTVAQPRAASATQVLAMLAALVLIVACFGIQVAVVGATSGLAESMLLLVCVAVEFGLIRVIGNW